MSDNPLVAAGTRVRAHEFHRTVSEPAHGVEPAWQLADGSPSGWAGPGLLASWLHLHWAGIPQAAPRLVRAAIAGRPALGANREAACTARRGWPA